MRVWSTHCFKDENDRQQEEGGVRGEGGGGGGGGEGEGRKIRRKKVFVDRLHDVFSPVQTPYFSNVIGHGPKVVCSMVHCLSGL